MSIFMRMSSPDKRDDDDDWDSIKKLQIIIGLVTKACPRLQFIAGDSIVRGRAKGVIIRHQAGDAPNEALQGWLKHMWWVGNDYCCMSSFFKVMFLH